MFGFDSDKAGMLAQIVGCSVVIPLSETAMAVGVPGFVAMVVRQAADQRAGNRFVPLGVIVDRLIQLQEYRLYFVLL